MKLLEGIMTLKGTPAEIPNCSRDHLPELFLELGYKVGAEIGVYKGAFTEKFCKVGLKVYAIDPWKAFETQGKYARRQERQDFLYGHTQRTLAPYIENGLCSIIRKTSMEAVEDFEDESLDWCYIDGDHSLRYFMEDLCEWPKKIKKGGIVSGHDYFNTRFGARNTICQVKAALDCYTKVFNIDNWYIFGNVDPTGKNKDDSYSSWLWIKK